MMTKTRDIQILNPTSQQHLDHVKNLIREFVKRYLGDSDDARFTNEYFDPSELPDKLKSWLVFMELKL